jgi:hypothetical protein
VHSAPASYRGVAAQVEMCQSKGLKQVFSPLYRSQGLKPGAFKLWVTTGFKSCRAPPRHAGGLLLRHDAGDGQHRPAPLDHLVLRSLLHRPHLVVAQGGRHVRVGGAGVRSGLLFALSFGSEGWMDGVSDGGASCVLVRGFWLSLAAGLHPI